MWKKKIIVVHVNGTQHTKVSAVTGTVNIVQSLDALMIVVNVGRVLKMRKQEIIYIAVDNKDADWFLGELCKPGIITDTCLRVDRKKKMLETSNYQVRAVPLSGYHTFVPMSPIDIYLHSNKPLTMQLGLLENRFYELRMITMHLSMPSIQINMRRLIDILNDRRM